MTTAKLIMPKCTTITKCLKVHAYKSVYNFNIEYLKSWFINQFYVYYVTLSYINVIKLRSHRCTILKTVTNIVDKYQLYLSNM
jgi:hypothetical protein